MIKEKLDVKIDDFNFPVKATTWFSAEDNATKITGLVVENLIPGILKTVDNEGVKQFIRTRFEARLHQMNFGEWIAVGLESLSNSEQQSQLMSDLLKVLSNELHANKDALLEKVKKAIPWYTMGIVDKKLAEGIFDGLSEFIDQAKGLKSLIRERINLYVLDFIDQLKKSPEMQQKVISFVFLICSKERCERVCKFYLG